MVVGTKVAGRLAGLVARQGDEVDIDAQIAQISANLERGKIDGTCMTRKRPHYT